MRFDPSQPYAELIGVPGVAYEQSGRRFTPGGREVLLSFGEDGEAVVTPGEADEAPLPPAGQKDYADLHWRALKALVEAAGGEWTNKEDALRFLNGAA